MKFSILLTNEEILLEIGRRLSAIRIQNRITQADLAAKAGISVRTYRRLENGGGLGNWGACGAVPPASGLAHRRGCLPPPATPSPREIFELETRHKPLPKRVRKPRAQKGGAQ